MGKNSQNQNQRSTADSSPPVGYPTRDNGEQVHAQKNHSRSQAKTKSKGGGFWKGCFAGMCCCCCLDVCC